MENEEKQQTLKLKMTTEQLTLLSRALQFALTLLNKFIGSIVTKPKQTAFFGALRSRVQRRADTAEEDGLKAALEALLTEVNTQIEKNSKKA